jgi:phosphoribosylformylglycinamidine synthase
MLGLMEGLEKRVTLDFKKGGDWIYLLGEPKNDLASSEYLYSYCGVKDSPAPAFDLDEEYTFQQHLAALIDEQWFASAHDVSDGGLLIAVAESALAGKKGFDLQVDLNSTALRGLRFDAFLFGESQSRAIVSVAAAKKADFEKRAAALGLKFLALGQVKEERIWQLQNQTLLTLEEGEALYEGALPKYLNA